MCPHNGVAAGVWIFNVRTDVGTCICTRGLYGHRKRVCTGSALWEKNPLLHLGLDPTSVLHLAFQLDALPTELVTVFVTDISSSPNTWHCVFGFLFGVGPSFTPLVYALAYLVEKTGWSLVQFFTCSGIINCIVLIG